MTRVRSVFTELEFLLLERFDRLDHVGGVRLRRGLLGHVPDDLAAFHEERRALENAGLQCRHAERRGDLAVIVGDEGEGKGELVAERLLRLGLVAAHAEHLDALFGERLPVVAQRAALLRAAGRVGLRVEIHERRALGVDVLEVHGLAVLILGGNFRRGGSDGERRVGGEGE